MSASQLEYFTSIANVLQTALGTVKGATLRLVRHVANTHAALTMPDSHLDMVRIGGGLFGQESNVIPLGLRPAFTWSTRVALVRRVPAGTVIGYGMAYPVEKDAIIATLPGGWACVRARARACMIRLPCPPPRCCTLLDCLFDCLLARGARHSTHVLRALACGGCLRVSVCCSGVR